MAGDLAALEARVSELERQIRHVLPAKIDAVAYGVSLMHADVRAIRDQLGRHGEELTRHGAMLEEILRRLPQPGDPEHASGSA